MTGPFIICCWYMYIFACKTMFLLCREICHFTSFLFTAKISNGKVIMLNSDDTSLMKFILQLHVYIDMVEKHMETQHLSCKLRTIF